MISKSLNLILMILLLNNFIIFLQNCIDTNENLLNFEIHKFCGFML